MDFRILDLIATVVECCEERCPPGSVVHGSGDGAEAQGDVGDRSPELRMPILPFKLNQERRRHIPRQQRKLTNWPTYDASLRQRGSLTVWFTDEAIAAWAAETRTTRGGQARYSPLAILTALTLRAVLAWFETGSHAKPGWRCWGG